MSSYKSTPGGIVMALLVLALFGCAGGDPGATSDSSFGSGDSSDVREPALDFGEDWDDGWIDELSKSGTGRDGKSGAGKGAGSAGIAGERRTYWGIVLKSFSAKGHREAATNMVRSCAQIDPRLGRAHVHTTERGSVVVYGVFEEASGPEAQRDLKWIKEVKLRDRPVFPRALLSRITVGPDPDRMNPLALMSARRRYPDLNPLYTLQVGVWGDFGSGKLSRKEIRGRGAKYAQELRAQGNEAYFHYDDNSNLCMVTVGLFDHTAIDGQSGLLSPDVEAYMKKFSANLVNGEPLHEQVDPRRPHLGTRVQPPNLVLVPKK